MKRNLIFITDDKAYFITKIESIGFTYKSLIFPSTEDLDEVIEIAKESKPIMIVVDSKLFQKRRSELENIVSYISDEVDTPIHTCIVGLPAVELVSAHWAEDMEHVRDLLKILN